MLGSKCDLKTHVRNVGYPLPYKLGPQNHFFRRFHNSTSTLTAYIFGTKRGIHKGSSAFKLQGVYYIVSKQHELWSTNSFKLEVSFHPSSVNSAFHFIARLRRRRSTNGTQPNFAKRWRVGRANNLP